MPRSKKSVGAAAQSNKCVLAAFWTVRSLLPLAAQQANSCRLVGRRLRTICRRASNWYNLVQELRKSEPHVVMVRIGSVAEQNTVDSVEGRRRELVVIAVQSRATGQRSPGRGVASIPSHLTVVGHVTNSAAFQLHRHVTYAMQAVINDWKSLNLAHVGLRLIACK